MNSIMGHLENWLLGLATFLALIFFLYAVFDVARRLLARLALRLCRMRESPEGGFVCELKRKLHNHADKSLLSRFVMMGVSFAVLFYIVVEHSPKL